MKIISITILSTSYRIRIFELFLSCTPKFGIIISSKGLLVLKPRTNSELVIYFILATLCLIDGNQIFYLTPFSFLRTIYYLSVAMWTITIKSNLVARKRTSCSRCIDLKLALSKEIIWGSSCVRLLGVIHIEMTSLPMLSHRQMTGLIHRILIWLFWIWL